MSSECLRVEELARSKPGRKQTAKGEEENSPETNHRDEGDTEYEEL
jgi:hypothetical protein